MFELPRERLHAVPRTPPGRVDINSFDGELVGKSLGIARDFLEDKGCLEDLSAVSLVHQIREAVFDHSTRQEYVDRALSHLKTKQLQVCEQYDVILVGAGLHSATYVQTIRRNNPSVKVLVVEKTSTVCSTFAELGDSLVLNSPTYARVGLNSNIVPGHFVQTSDFDELLEKSYPTAKHLFELAVMVFFHSDAEIVFDFAVTDVHRVNGNYLLHQGEKAFTTKNLIVANGMGGPIEASFLASQRSNNILFGDDFIAKCHRDSGFADSVRDKSLAVIGNGDTANCVLEYILPTIYPNKRYGFYRKNPALPTQVYWVGQDASSIREFFFKNKRRYGHSGGIIEVFWEGDTSLELPADLWRKTKELLNLVPEKLVSLVQRSKRLVLKTTTREIEVDLVVDCMGRYNPLSASLLKDGYEFIKGDIVFYGGSWNEELSRFAALPRVLRARRLACKLKGENIFLLGGACPLGELIDDEEAKNGSSQYQETRVSLTNSKWSLEHTLPRSVALAEQHAAQLAG